MVNKVYFWWQCGCRWKQEQWEWCQYWNVIFSAPNWDIAPIIFVQIPLINEHIFCKYFVRLSVGNATKGFATYGCWHPFLFIDYTVYIMCNLIWEYGDGINVDNPWNKYFKKKSWNWNVKCNRITNRQKVSQWMITGLNLQKQAARW